MNFAFTVYWVGFIGVEISFGEREFWDFIFKDGVNFVVLLVFLGVRLILLFTFDFKVFDFKLLFVWLFLSCKI